MFALLVAAPFLAPIPLNQDRVFSASDVPHWLQQAGNSKAIRTRIYIRPDGTTDRCLIENPIRDNRLGDLTCKLFVKRARFSTSKWMDGTPVWGVYRSPVLWIVDDYATPYGDVEASVATLPKGFGTSATVHLVLAVDESGTISACQAIAAKPKKGDPPFGTLVRAACKVIRSSAWKPVPSTEFTGKPMKSVQHASVRFSTK